MSFLRTIIEKAGTVIGVRRRLNFIEGSNVTLTIVDDSANDEIDITIAAAGGSGSPGGLDTHVQFNDGGSFGGEAAFTYDKTTNKLTVDTIHVDTVQAHTSAGLVIEATGGGDVALFGAGGGQNATFYDGVKLDASTASRVLSTDASKNITALNTATYPDLTELSYVKGVTSAIQTQIGNKQDTLVSATNIKTINGSSVLGAGDLVVSGSLPDLIITKYAPALDQTITAGYSAYYSGYYEIADTKFLEIGEDSTLEIG